MKILIVDDSIVYRSAIRTALEGVAEVTSVQVAPNGKIALDYVKSGKIDVLTLDIEMPVMDGLETIREIRKINKEVLILVFSSQNPAQIKKTLNALSEGADDFVQKIEGGSDIEKNIELIRNELIPRIKALRSNVNDGELIRHKEIKIDKPISAHIRKDEFHPEIICIGSSTGGPDALRKIFSLLKGLQLKVPILLVQHMPPVFTTQLAKMLDSLVDFIVKEAEDGEKIVPGVCYVAPGNFHMTAIEKNEGGRYIKLNQDEKVCFVRPSLDVLLFSVSKIYKNGVLNVILTGMGEDGLNGIKSFAEKKKKVVIQDKETCVVWGMPGAIFNNQLHDEMYPLQLIPELLVKYGG